MINVIVNAYAVNPFWGSEQGLGWHWVTNLARFCNVHVITEGEFKSNIDKALADFPFRDRLHFYYNPLPDKVRRMCWNQGDWRFYYYYRKWQKKTLEIAKKIISENKIDVLHQLNMIGFREPGYLWKIKDIPLVWGPIGGMELMPTSYLEGSSAKQRFVTYLKNAINAFQTRHGLRVGKAIKGSSRLIAAVKGVKDCIEMHYNRSVILINETGCRVNGNKIHRCKNPEDPFILLWVGKFDFRKQLNLAIETLSRLNDCNVVLHIAGGGTPQEEDKFKRMAKDLDVDNNRIVWHGFIDNSKVQDLMQASDLLLFTSIMEGTPHVVLEAISNCLPVVCFDACGQAGAVNESVGVKIPLSYPSRSTDEFATAIRSLIENPERLSALSEGCLSRQKELSWEAKAERMVEIYREVLGERGAQG